MATRKKKSSASSRGRVITVRLIVDGAGGVRRASTGTKRKSKSKATSKRKSSSSHKSTRGMATRSKHDGGVSKRKATAYGVLAARLGRTVHTAQGKRPRGYTKADAVVAARAASAERARLGKRR